MQLTTNYRLFKAGTRAVLSIAVPNYKGLISAIVLVYSSAVFKEDSFMQYLIKNTWICERGKSPEAMGGFKAVAGSYRDLNMPCRLYADISGTMDTVVMEIEVDSLDGYFTTQRKFYAKMDDPTKDLIGSINSNMDSGSRVIYEIIEF